MVSRLKQIFLMTIPILLPLLGGLLFLSLSPNYEAPQDRSLLLQEQQPGIEILSEQTVGRYIITEFRSQEVVGFGVFQKTLGRWKFDHMTVSQENLICDSFYMNDTLYFLIGTRLEEAASVTIQFVNGLNGQDAGLQTYPLEGKTLLILPAAQDTDEIQDITFRDASGNILT